MCSVFYIRSLSQSHGLDVSPRYGSCMYSDVWNMISSQSRLQRMLFCFQMDVSNEGGHNSVNWSNRVLKDSNKFHSWPWYGYLQCAVWLTLKVIITWNWMPTLYELARTETRRDWPPPAMNCMFDSAESIADDYIYHLDFCTFSVESLQRVAWCRQSMLHVLSEILLCIRLVNFFHRVNWTSIWFLTLCQLNRNVIRSMCRKAALRK